MVKARHGDQIPLVRRQDVGGFVRRDAVAGLRGKEARKAAYLERARREIGAWL